jgi:hypothetical protein
MPIFNVDKPIVNESKKLADGILAFSNKVGDAIVALYRQGKEMLWARPNFTIADAQAVIDAMGDNAVPLFTLTVQLGIFIKNKYPSSLTDEELQSPVPYSIVNGKIVLDPTAKYPTEVEVQDDSGN